MEINLKKLFELQKVLDERIEKEHPRVEGEDRLDMKILALQVELGELANELPEAFKFWSNKKNNFKKALKEYVDCLHFYLSIGLQKGWSSGIEFSKPVTPNVTIQFNNLFKKTGDFSIYQTYMNYKWSFSLFIELGKMIGFTWEEIEQAYIEKNEVNHERQNNKY